MKRLHERFGIASPVLVFSRTFIQRMNDDEWHKTGFVRKSTQVFSVSTFKRLKFHPRKLKYLRSHGLSVIPMAPLGRPAGHVDRPTGCANKQPTWPAESQHMWLCALTMNLCSRDIQALPSDLMWHTYTNTLDNGKIMQNRFLTNETGKEKEIQREIDGWWLWPWRWQPTSVSWC